jgi:bifunctional NMN adenylyltransferase/nudix hydrolase
MAKQNVGVVIGRFQVPELHEAHQQLLQHVIEHSDLLVILVGVSPIDGYAPEYPLTFAQRVEVIRAFSVEVIRDFSHEHALILPVMDVPTNNEWSTQLDALLRGLFPTDVITLYGGRDSFIPHYTGSLVTACFEPSPAIAVSGSSVRAGLKLELFSDAFMRGQIFALNQQYPKVYPTVDVAHVRGKFAAAEVLLIQRADTGIWCFPGGFVDPTDGTYEQAAKRELSEEVGLLSEAPLEYIGSAYIHDWRYRGSRDKIMTTFFLSLHTSGFAKLKTDEVTEARYVSIQECRDLVAPAHKPLAKMLVAYMQKEGL